MSSPRTKIPCVISPQKDVSKPNCHPSGQPPVETCPGVDDGTKFKNWKTKEEMGLANANILPMGMFASMEQNSNADKCIALYS